MQNQYAFCLQCLFDICPIRTWPKTNTWFCAFWAGFGNAQPMVKQKVKYSTWSTADPTENERLVKQELAQAQLLGTPLNDTRLFQYQTTHSCNRLISRHRIYRHLSNTDLTKTSSSLNVLCFWICTSLVCQKTAGAR